MPSPPKVDLSHPSLAQDPLGADVAESESHALWTQFPPHKRAAVLAIVTPSPAGAINDLAVVVTQRSQKLRTSPGDSAFPGGKVDRIQTQPQAPQEVQGPPEEYEDEWTCALREASEEIGFPGERSPHYTFTRLATLPCYLSVTNDVVRVCLALVHGPSSPGEGVPLAVLAPNLAAAEVDLAYTIPLRPLLDFGPWYVQARNVYYGAWVYHRYNIPLASLLEVQYAPGYDPSHEDGQSVRIKGLTGHLVNDVARALYPDTQPAMRHLPMLGGNRIVRAYIAEHGVTPSTPPPKPKASI